MTRYVRVLTSTGRWEFMRVLERSPWHLLVEDARGQRFITARPTLKRERHHGTSAEQRSCP